METARLAKRVWAYIINLFFYLATGFACSPFLPNRGFKTQAGWLPFRSRWRRAFLSSYEPQFPDTGKSGS